MGRAKDSLAGRVRRLGRRLPRPVRALLAHPATHPAGQPTPAQSPAPPPAPELTVVVVLAGAGPSQLGDCLTSLAAQSLTRLEVVVVVDHTDATSAAESASDSAANSASDYSTVAAARAVTERDPRFAVRAVPPGSPAAARAAAAAGAQGEFLAFVAATDTVPSTAYATLVGSLRRSGSDLAAGSVQVLREGRPRRPAWAVLTHDRDRTGQTLADLPAGPAGRRPGQQGLPHRLLERPAHAGAGPPEPDSYPALAALLRAARFDLLATVTLIQRGPIERQIAGAAAAPLLAPPVLEPAALRARLDHLEQAWGLVRSHADPAVAADWLGRMIDGDLGDLAADAYAGGQAYRALLQPAAARYLEAADSLVRPHVRVERKLRLWLAATSAWTELALLVDHVRLFGAMPRTEVRDGLIFAVADALPGIAGAPPPLLELGDQETTLTGCVERVAWQQDRLVVQGWAFVGGLDLTGAEVTMTADLVQPDSGRVHPCEITPVRRTAANRWSRLRYQDVAPGGFVVSAQTRGLDTDPARWELRITQRAHGVERAGALRAVAPYGAGKRLFARPLHGADDAVRVVPMLDPGLGFVLQVRADRVRAATLYAGEGGRVGGELQVWGASLDLVTVAATCGAAELTAELAPPGDTGGRAFELTVPAGGERRAWEVRAVDARGRRHRVAWPVEGVFGDRVGSGSEAPAAAWSRSPRGFCELASGPRRPEVTAVTVDDGRLTVVVSQEPGVENWDGTRLVGPLAEVRATSVTHDRAEGRVHLVFSLRASRWGGPELPLPSGEYRVVATGLPSLTCADQMLGELPYERLTGDHHLLVGRAAAGDLVIRLEAPRADDERGRFAQERLQEWYRGLEAEPLDAVLFECYRGDFVTDSQLEIHHGLRRRGTTLELLWGVHDLSVPVPEGGPPLVIGSRAWYAALGSARFLCRNIELERYFRKRPHQRYLQTFHGYPFKSMGASLWRAKGRPNRWWRRRRPAGAATGTRSLCPPSSASSSIAGIRLHRSGAGHRLSTERPAGRRRPRARPTRVLRTLGIDEDKVVVLYAPTWRDTVATTPWTAKMFDELDLAALADQLGDGFALISGATGTTSAKASDIDPQVLDVSAYPEINELILAADVAVLDYSSLRFDWMITEKPVLFFVPDLEDYLQSRTVLFDFAPTAPGPLLRTTADVGAALHDLNAVAAEYAAARALFNRRYNRLHDGHATERVIDAFFQ